MKHQQFFFPAIIILIIDQLIKLAIFRAQDNLPLVVIPNFLNIVYITNSGLAFGLFTGNNLLLAAISIGVASVIIILKDEFKPGTEILAARFILGGTLGNLADRIIYGSVIDYVALPFFPVFNLADSSLTIGAYLILHSYFSEKLKQWRKHRKQN